MDWDTWDLIDFSQKGFTTVTSLAKIRTSKELRTVESDGLGYLRFNRFFGERFHYGHVIIEIRTSKDIGTVESHGMGYLRFNRFFGERFHYGHVIIEIRTSKDIGTVESLII